MLFDLFRKQDINKGVEEFRNTEHAVLLDVRTEEEYRGGHIPGSMNIDVAQIHTAPSVLKDKTIPLFVYCYSGARSGRAVSLLKNMGYTNVKNIGGISAYSGGTER